MIRYSVRINLADFIASEYENEIVRKVLRIAMETRGHIFLKLWYNKDVVSQEQLVNFLNRHEQLLIEVGTNIHAGEHETWTQKSWFNIRKKGTPSYADYRHEVLYDTTEDIIKCLEKFQSTVMCMDDVKVPQNSPMKKELPPQQHNGYRVTIKRVSNGIQK